jgi:succinate dehydrogenase / fumarate reductase cytochrome b subunit
MEIFFRDELVVQQKPMFLNLFQLRFPITAIVSILHRISGVLMFLFIPGMLWLLHMSVDSLVSFDKIQTMLAQPIAKVLLLSMLLPIIYHIIAGMRHIIMDVGFFESKRAARASSKVVFLLSIAALVGVGIQIW